mmetsp:Transcript_11341/g.40221  ORF Transcript_11341/g.40221 Transcript_11341/m.40221 type:complete len:245 (-) Transcript_11341:832-1566(-)
MHSSMHQRVFWGACRLPLLRLDEPLCWERPSLHEHHDNDDANRHDHHEELHNNNDHDHEHHDSSAWLLLAASDRSGQGHERLWRVVPSRRHVHRDVQIALGRLTNDIPLLRVGCWLRGKRTGLPQHHDHHFRNNNNYHQLHHLKLHHLNKVINDKLQLHHLRDHHFLYQHHIHDFDNRNDDNNDFDDNDDFDDQNDDFDKHEHNDTTARKLLAASFVIRQRWRSLWRNVPSRELYCNLCARVWW